MEDGTVEELTRSECFDLLRQDVVGRLGTVHAGQPLIFPVNYVVDGDDVVFRTDWGTKLASARVGRICFEVDRLEPSSRSGWSVLVEGYVEEVDDAAQRADIQHRFREALTPWDRGSKSHYLRVFATRVTGRRVAPDPAVAVPSVIGADA